MNDIRARVERERVLTATPAQRVVMLYERLELDLARCHVDAAGRSAHLAHAMAIVAELADSLDLSVGGPSENLQRIYGWMLGQLGAAQFAEAKASAVLLHPVEQNVATLLTAWRVVAQESGSGAGSGAGDSAAVGGWSA